MMQRTVSVLASLALTLTLAGAFGSGCTTSPPPSNDDGEQSGGSTGEGSGGGASNGGSTFASGSGGDAAFDDSGGTGSGGGSGVGSGGDASTSSGSSDGSTTGGSSDAGGGSCGIDTSFTGQVGADNTHGGGEVGSTTDLPQDAGIQAVWDWIQQENQNRDMWPEEDFETEEREANVSLDDPIEINGAIVVSTLFGEVGNQAFYIQDQNRAVEVDLGSAVSSGTPIKVGDKVSFTVTGVAVQNGLPQVYEISDFSKDSSGNPVPILDIESPDDASGEDVHKLVRVGGELTNAEGCGGDYKCFDMVDGDGNVLVEYRAEVTGDQGPSEGWCSTYVGPLGQFPGPVADADDPTLQVQPNNFDWTP